MQDRDVLCSLNLRDQQSAISFILPSHEVETMSKSHHILRNQHVYGSLSFCCKLLRLGVRVTVWQWGSGANYQDTGRHWHLSSEGLLRLTPPPVLKTSFQLLINDKWSDARPILGAQEHHDPSHTAFNIMSSTGDARYPVQYMRCTLQWWNVFTDGIHKYTYITLNNLIDRLNWTHCI